MEVTTITCLKCGETIYSRCRHDMRFCSCGKTAIDGGQDYTRIMGSLDSQVQILSIKPTPQELYEDWNKRIDKYGLFRNIT